MKTFIALLLLSNVSAYAAAHDDASTDVSCLLGFPENPDAQMILTSKADKFSIFTPSSVGKTIEIIYDQTPVAIFMAPVEAPLMACVEDESAITVWDNLVYVNGSYFMIENATSVVTN